METKDPLLRNLRLILLLILLLFAWQLFSQPTNYRIRAVKAGDTLESVSNVAETYKHQLYIPNAFSPNGDGLNDSLYLVSRNLTEVMLTVYSRFGGVVKVIDSLTGSWNGADSCGNIMDGIYTYECKFIDIYGNRYRRSGRVLVLR